MADRPAGGFMLSPPASSTPSSNTHPTLPHPRDSPLRPGGVKESAFIRHVDQQMLHIQRRFAKRTSPESPHLSNIDRDKADAWGDVKGYATMKDACGEIEALVDVIWVSGTPGLQVPYLISLALLLGHVVQAMPPSAKALFRLVEKMDHAFASLLQGRDVDSGERLPGFAGARGVSGTEKVRIRSLVERTRVDIVGAFKRGEFEVEPVDEVGGDQADNMDAETDGEGGLVLDGDDGLAEAEGEDDSIDMSIARVYDRTIQELGDSLEGPLLGIVTEGRG